MSEPKKTVEELKVEHDEVCRRLADIDARIAELRPMVKEAAELEGEIHRIAYGDRPLWQIKRELGEALVDRMLEEAPPISSGGAPIDRKAAARALVGDELGKVDENYWK